MSKRLGQWVALVAAGVVTGCATAGGAHGSAPQRAAADYYPLAVGNAWTYEATRLGETREMPVKIVGREDGYFVDNNGARLTIDAYGVRDERRYLLQEPIRTDHAWKNTVSVQTTERYTIQSVGATCEVPAGVFPDCVMVSSTVRVDPQSELINDLTFARGVGLVSVQVDLKRNGTRTPQHKMVLKSYSVAPPAGEAAR